MRAIDQAIRRSFWTTSSSGSTSTGPGVFLDLGCGTGQLAIPLAKHVAEGVGLDPEPEMIAEADRQAQASRVANISWTQGNSADLPGEFEPFKLVTLGRSFHWMDLEKVLAALDHIVTAEGGLVIANDSCLVLRSATAWQQAIEDIQNHYLRPDAQPRPTTTSDGHQPHEEILARSPFRQIHRRVYEFDRPWTIEQAIGYLYSTSLPLRRLLNDRRTEFEQEVTDALLAIDPNGQFIEPVALEVLTATRR